MVERRVLISGGSRGIGAACVERFCAQGDRVTFLYRSDREAAELVSRRTGARAICADVSSPDAVARAVEIVRAEAGGVDVLVNNAGISLIAPFDTMDDDTWRRMIDTNLSAAFYLSRAVVHDMIRTGAGRIINIGSMWGKTGASCEVAYSAAKAGLRGLTMALAKELGPSGVTVNCVEPGVIDTDMNRALNDATRRELCGETPLCRIGQAWEVAAAVAFLASEDASFITGQCLGVDGGFAV